MKKQVALLLIISAVVLLAGCGKREPVVATVGSEKITAQEFKDTFVQRFRGEENAQHQPYENREKLVRELAVERAKYLEAVAKGMEKRPELKDQLAAAASRKALDELYRQEVLDKVISDQTAKEFYDQSGQEVKGRHILLKTVPGDSAKRDSTRIRARADSIKHAIQSGLDFKAAAKMFSEDGTTAADSGDLGWFQWGRMVDAFQEAAWNAKPGQLVGPVSTEYGYHLILVEDKRPVQDRRPFDEMKDQIKAQLREVEGQKLMETAREYVAQLRERGGVKYDEANLETFRQRLLDPSVTKTQPLGPVFTEEQKKLVAATYKGGQATIADMIEKLGANAHRVNWNDPQATKDLVNAIIEPKLLDRDAEKKGLIAKAERDPGVMAEKRRVLVGLVEKEEITDKVKPTPEDERRYYENNLANYIQPEMRTAREIFIKEDSAKAARVRARALKGENFRTLALRFNEKESTKPDTGRMGPFEEKRFGLIGRTVFTLQKEGDISDVIPVGPNYSVVQLVTIVPSRTKTYEEAQGDVRKQCRQAMTDEAERKLEETLLAKYKLNINAKNLAAALPMTGEKKKEDKLAREP